MDWNTSVSIEPGAIVAVAVASNTPSLGLPSSFGSSHTATVTGPCGLNPFGFAGDPKQVSIDVIVVEPPPSEPTSQASSPPYMSPIASSVLPSSCGTQPGAGGAWGESRRVPVPF